MNYRHAYHAGNFADVFKHIILVAITKTFLQKESAFCYLDTHAGMGIYDLFSEAAQKNKEYENGIAKIFSAKNTPKIVTDYLECVYTANKNSLSFYPGSPYFVKNLLRPQDRMILSELHPEEFKALKKFFSHDKQIAVHHQDAYQSLKAFLPPKERRGFILIDPPYEKPEEFSQLVISMSEAMRRWETGVYAIWYPIKTRPPVDHFLNLLQKKIQRPVLKAELSLFPENTDLHLNGCGMVIINPPWKLEEQLREVIAWLWENLSLNKQGRYSVASYAR